MFYKTLRACELSKDSMANSVKKWQDEADLTISAQSWDKIWKISKNSLVQNKMKWVTIQINRHILPTNYTVSKCDPSVNPGCSLCTNSHAEKLTTLLWDCQVVQEFWGIIQNILNHHFPGFKLGIKEAIFGDLNSEGPSIQNTLLLLARQFIYRQKFTTKSLDEVQYLNFMRNELKNLYNTHVFREKVNKFMLDWQSIFDHFDIDYGSMDGFIS
jgi:hypothetical protein